MITNITLAYKPQVHRFRPMTEFAGIEYLTIEFPLTKYPGHLVVSPEVHKLCYAFNFLIYHACVQHSMLINYMIL